MKISDAELEVMKIVWNKGKVTSFTIIDDLKEKQKWNESTIRTLINRLQHKKAIIIAEKNGKTYTYESCIDEKEYQLKESDTFVDKIYHGSISSMLLNFVEQSKLTKQDLQELMNKIEED